MGLNTRDIITGTDEDILVHGEGLDAIKKAVKKGLGIASPAYGALKSKKAGGDMSVDQMRKKSNADGERQASEKMGSGNHKYIKKYMGKNGRMVYVYDDGDTKIKDTLSYDDTDARSSGGGKGKNQFDLDKQRELISAAKKSKLNRGLTNSEKATGSKDFGTYTQQRGQVGKSIDNATSPTRKKLKKAWNGSINSVSDFAKSMKIK